MPLIQRRSQKKRENFFFVFLFFFKIGFMRFDDTRDMCLIWGSFYSQVDCCRGRDDNDEGEDVMQEKRGRGSKRPFYKREGKSKSLEEPKIQ